MPSNSSTEESQSRAELATVDGILLVLVGLFAGLGIGVAGASLANRSLPCRASEFYEVDTGVCLTEEAIQIRVGLTPAAEGHEHG